MSFLRGFRVGMVSAVASSVRSEHELNISTVRRNAEHELKMKISVAELSPLHQQRLRYLPRMPPVSR